jgi:hypothetical protein
MQGEDRRISVRSGHSRGKDYTAAVGSVCWLHLRGPSKVINTAPTGRQVRSIMMSEISKIWKNAKVPLGGELLADRIVFREDPDWFLEGFKADDKNVEAWTGYHSPNLLIVVTEASGIADETFTAIEGLLTGHSKELLIFNPNHLTGEAFKSAKSPNYRKFVLSCLDAPNVVEKKTIIPGQVDWPWVDDKVRRWADRVHENEIDTTLYDFEWENEDGKHWYRPNDLFRVKVLGEFPQEDESQLIPLSWCEAANERWRKWKESGEPNGLPVRLGVDVAGMGRDKTVFVFKHGNVVSRIDTYTHNDTMEVAGKVKGCMIKMGDKSYIDTIGEGAGVYARLSEQDVPVTSVKFSESAKGYTDLTGERSFANMKAWLFWAVRDALDPKHGGSLALPPDDELTEDLTNIKVKKMRSDGSIVLEEKEEVKKRLGRSPDKGDALANTFYPDDRGNSWASTWSVQAR